jgi:hypothetical protein
MRTAYSAGALAALALSTVLLPTHTIAGPNDYVVTPIVEAGEREIDFKAGTAKLREDTRSSKESIGLGWGATSWWFTELYALWKKESGSPHQFDAWEWENKFQLTETGKYPVDLGFLFEIERPQDRSEGYEYRWGPLLQADLGDKVQSNLNVLFEKHIRSEETSEAELGYQWQLKYRWRPTMEFGFQGFGNIGPWQHWLASSEQAHIAGPALFGRIKTGEGRQAIKYNAGLLFGLSDGAPSNTARLQVEYEF